MGFFFLIFLFGCGCGDLKRMDFWDWLFSRGFDVKFEACFKKGARRTRRGKFRPCKKNPLNNQAGSGSQV